MVSQYLSIVGKPVLPPFWALGFHQCSWDYNNSDVMETVVKTYQDKGYPFESIWADINYMDKKIDFTVDSLPGRPYEGLPMAVDKWHT